MPEIIYIIIARALLALPWSLAVSDPALLRKERIKYFGCLVGSVILGAAIGLGVVVGGSCGSSK